MREDDTKFVLSSFLFFTYILVSYLKNITNFATIINV